MTIVRGSFENINGLLYEKTVFMIETVFGQILKKIRLSQNISQEKLAEYSDLDRTYISLLERGLRQPTLTTIFKLSKVFGIKPSELIQQVENLYENN